RPTFVAEVMDAALLHGSVLGNDSRITTGSMKLSNPFLANDEHWGHRPGHRVIHLIAAGQNGRIPERRLSCAAVRTEETAR
ncbi:MAG TPA: hypothetical protein VK639_18450, partial [Terriglobales bacterium]|nr:hypothetical protein [Terriglobales bacterium]